jgi:hypothetical protein
MRPQTTRYASAPKGIDTSLATAAMVSQRGVSPYQVATRNTLTSSSLSAAGSSILPRSEVQLNRFARYPSNPSLAAAMKNSSNVNE